MIQLNKVTTDPAILKILHGSNMDILWLQRDFGVYIVNLFDTGVCSRVLGLEQHSFKYILSRYCQENANKSLQLADWRVRPLPDDHQFYAI